MEVESKKSSSESRVAVGGRRKRIWSWGWAAVSVVLVVGLVILILGLTVFKAKRPLTTVNSVSLKDVQLSIDPLGPRVFLNVSLDSNISVKNPNRVAFQYTESSAVLKYRGQVVGEVPIPAGQIGAGQTLPMNITLTLMADRLLSNSGFYADVSSGILPLSTYTIISGHVRILFRIHVVSYTNCDLYVDVRSRTLANPSCHYATKL